MQPPLYPADAVQPFRDELTVVGFKELRTPAEVNLAVEAKGTAICVINSVCGCAGGAARPGLALALQHKVIPDRLVTVFAGMERDAVDRVRQLHAHLEPPSSPSIVLFKDGRVAAMIGRHRIEGNTPQQVAGQLIAAFNEHCSRPGPSIPREEFEKLPYASSCGSGIPRLKP